MLTIEKVVRWLGKAESRDKLCKILQYLCRLLSVRYLNRNQYQHLKYNSLYESLKEARKLFRLFKSFDQYEEMLQLIFHGREDLDTVLHILVKFGYFLYWFFDNISVAAKLKLFQLDHLKYGRIASSCRLFALLLSILAYAYSRLSDNLRNGKQKRTTLKCIQNICDLLPASEDSGLFKVLNISINQQLLCLGGLSSAVIATHQLITLA